MPFVNEGRPATLTISRGRVPVPAGARARGIQGQRAAADRRRLRARHRHAQVLGRQGARFHARPAALQARGDVGNRDRARVPGRRRACCCRTACASGSRTRTGRRRTSSRSPRRPRGRSASSPSPARSWRGRARASCGAKSLRLDTSADMGTVERATATGNVDTRRPARVPRCRARRRRRPGPSACAARSSRWSSARKGILQEAVASGAASLEIEPGPGQPPERRRVSGARLRFDFDAEGRLLSLQGPRGSNPRVGRARPLAVLTAEPLAAGAGASRRVESDTFVAFARSRLGRGAGRRLRGLGRVQRAGTQGLGRPLGLRRRGGHAAADARSRGSWTRPRGRSCADARSASARARAR